MTVPMALVDFIPNILFLLTIITLQRDLYPKFSKGAFALFAGGGIMVFAAGTYKAIWKLLYALGVCDFEKLNQSFFPMQATGFVLMGIAAVALLCCKQKKTMAVAVAPAVFSGTMLFVAGQVFGILALCICLCVMAGKRKNRAAGVLFIVAALLMLCMGYLSSRDFTQASMNWIAQFVNIAGQGSLLLASRSLHRSLLAE